MANAALNEDIKPRMVAVKLIRNYRPAGEFEVVGYERPAILKKNAAGMMETAQEAQFIDGELPPPAQSGTGFPDKLWAGAVIRLPKDEAVSTRKAGISEYELND